jgi:hypothetical protein
MPTRRSGDRKSRAHWQTSKWLVPLLVLLGIMAIGVLAASLLRNSRNATQQATQVDEANKITPSATPSVIVTPDFTATPTLDKSSAKLLIEGWLTAKSEAMGPDHEIAALDGILAEPSLTKWRADAEELKRNSEHRVYKHSVKEVESVEMIALTPLEGVTASPSSSPSPDPTASPQVQTGSPTASPQAISTSPTTSPTTPPETGIALPSPEIGKSTATAESAKVVVLVSESAEIIKAGKSEGTPQSEDLRIQYNLIRKDGKWRIQDWQIL